MQSIAGPQSEPAPVGEARRRPELPTGDRQDPKRPQYRLLSRISRRRGPALKSACGNVSVTARSASESTGRVPCSAGVNGATTFPRRVIVTVSPAATRSIRRAFASAKLTRVIAAPT